MNKEELRDALHKLNEEYGHDTEVAHYQADCLLIKYIDDKEIENAYDEIDKWYA